MYPIAACHRQPLTNWRAATGEGAHQVGAGGAGRDDGLQCAVGDPRRLLVLGHHVLVLEPCRSKPEIKARPCVRRWEERSSSVAERRDWRAAGARARWQPYPRQPSRRPTGRSHRCRSWLTARFAAVRRRASGSRASSLSREAKSNEASRRAVQPQHSTIRRRSCSRHSPQPRNRTPPEQHDEQRRGRQERGLEGRPEHRQHQGPRTGAMTSPCRLDLACEPRLGRRRQPARAGLRGSRGATSAGRRASAAGTAARRQ